MSYRCGSVKVKYRSVMTEGRVVCVCVSADGGGSRMDTMVRMRPLTVMCPHFFDTDMWHSWALLLHVLKDRERERERSANNAHWVGEAAAGGTCTDLKASYSGQDGAPLPSLLPCFSSLEVDGWSASCYQWKWAVLFTEPVDETRQRRDDRRG